MPHDPVRAADTRAWLERARADLEAGARDLSGEPALSGDAMFHAQQTAEKALEAFLAWHDEPFHKTHNLEELGEQCLSLDASLQVLIDQAVPLSEYAWKFRYPGETQRPPAEEARGALAAARSVYEAILDRFPEEARP